MGDTMQFSSAGSSSSLSPASLQHASGTRRPRPSSRAADTNLANQRSVRSALHQSQFIHTFSVNALQPLPGCLLEVGVVVDSAALCAGHHEVPGQGDGVAVAGCSVRAGDGPQQPRPQLLVSLVAVHHTQQDPHYLQNVTYLFDASNAS